MRLKLEKLREARNRPGTVGTMGTAHVYVDTCVPSRFPLAKTVGTNPSSDANEVPAFPSVPNDREHGNANVHTHVPAVPTVPSGKCDTPLASSIPDPLAGDPAAWEHELHQWATAHCIFRERVWGGLAALHSHYVEWSHGTGNMPPATLATFREWVVWQGFTLTGPLVYGLTLAAGHAVCRSV